MRSRFNSVPLVIIHLGISLSSNLRSTSWLVTTLLRAVTAITTQSRTTHHAFKRLVQRTNETLEPETSGASVSCERPHERLRSSPAPGNRCLPLQRAGELPRMLGRQKRS